MPDVVDIVSHARTLADCIKDSVVWSDITDACRSSHAGASAASHASTSFDLSPWMHALRGFKPTKLRAKSSEASRARAKALALVRVRDATMRDAGRDVWVCLAQLINGDAVTEELRGAVPASVEERFELCKRALESCERQSESKPGPPWSRKRAMYGFLIEQWHTRDDFLIVDVECTENAAGMAEDYEFTVIWKDGATSRLTWSDFKTLQTRVLAHVNASEDEKRFISSLKSAIVMGEIKVKVEDASPVGAAATLAVATMNDEDADVDVVVEPSDADSESVRGTEEQEQEPEGATRDDAARAGTCVDQDALGLAVDAEPTRWPLPMSDAPSTRKVQPARDSPARIDEAEPEPEERAIETGEQEEELEEQSKEADDVGVAQDQDMSDALLDGAGRRCIYLTLDGDDAPRDTEMVENDNRKDAANENVVDAYARGDSNPDATSRENEHSELQNSRESYEEERQRVMAAVKAAERHAAELKERVERAEAAIARAATKAVDGLPCSKQPDAVPKWPQSIINTTGKDTQWLNGRLYAVKRGTPTFPGDEEVRQYYAVKRGTPIGPDDEEVRRAKPKPKPKPKSKPKEKPRRETKTPGEVGPFYNCRSFVEMSETPRDNPEDDDEAEDARQDETDLQMLHEFVDFSLEEIDFMASWNVVARRFRVMTNDDIPLLCKSFAKTYAEKLLKDSEFYDKFVYTLTNLFDSGVINRVDVVDVLRFAKRALPVGRRPPTSPPSTRARDYVL